MIVKNDAAVVSIRAKRNVSPGAAGRTGQHEAHRATGRGPGSVINARAG